MLTQHFFVSQDERFWTFREPTEASRNQILQTYACIQVTVQRNPIASHFFMPFIQRTNNS